MYIKREPLGRGNLTFGKRRKRRFPILFILVYLTILGAATYVFLRLDEFQPRVLAALGPDPTPTPSIEELTTLGTEAYFRGNLVLAADYYRQASLMAPEDLEILTTLSRFLTLSYTVDSDVRHLQEAIEVADQIILLAPEDPRGYAMKSRALNWMGDTDQSAIEALRAIEKDYDYALGHAYLAEAYVDLGQLRQARDQAELALELDPYSVDARRNYAYVLEYYGDYGGAVQQYRQALQLHGELLDLWYGLARNYRGAAAREGSEELYQKSIETYQQIIMRTPDDPQPYTALGRTYFEFRDDEAAQINLERAIRLVCEDCPRMTYRELEEAGYIYDVSLLPDEMYIPAWRRLGMVYFTRRNYEDAIAIFEELIAWGEENDAQDDVPLEAYYVTAAAYYYLDKCNTAIPRTFEGLDIYEGNRMDDPIALNNILSVIILCRDYALTRPTVAFTFPERYEEPDVIVRRPGVGGGVTDAEEGNDTNQ